jgi:hypothetical protein
LYRLYRFNLVSWLEKWGGMPQDNMLYGILLWFPSPMALQNCHKSGLS